MAELRKSLIAAPFILAGFGVALYELMIIQPMLGLVAGIGGVVLTAWATSTKS